jgi:membrane protein DedA with SNARE-associated domain
MVNQVIESIADLGGVLLTLAAFVLGFGESALGFDLVVPGEVGMVLAGSAAAHNGTPVVAIIVAGSLGAVLGDCAGYAVGRKWGVDVVRHWRWTRRHLGPKLDRAHDYFEHRGGWAVFGARWVGALRAVVPVVAGSARMPFGRFILWDAPAAVLWVTAVALVGYHFGASVADTIDRIGLWWSVAVIAVIAAVVLVRRWRRRGQAGGAGDSDRGRLPTRRRRATPEGTTHG